MDVKPEDVAAESFQKNLPVFKNYASGLSNKALRRVLNALVEFPLQEGKLKFGDAKEQQAFTIGLHLIDCKITMISAVVKEELTSEEKK